MQNFETTLTEKGQITIPQEIRKLLGLHPKDKVRFEVEGDVVKIKLATSQLLAGFGAVSPKHRPENFQAMRDEFEEGVANDVISEA